MENEHSNPKKKKIIAGLLLTLSFVIMGLISWFIGKQLISYSKSPDEFREWVDTHFISGRIVYIAVCILQIVIAFIPGEPLEIIGGYAFGAIQGTVLFMIASTIGSMLVFGIVKRHGYNVIEIFFSREKIHSLKFLKTSKKKDALFFFIFLLPGTPKDLLCYFAGLTDINVKTWFFICTVGRLPSVITSTIGGNALGTANYKLSIIVFAVTMIISGIGMLIYNHIQKKKKEA